MRTATTRLIVAPLIGAASTLAATPEHGAMSNGAVTSGSQTPPPAVYLPRASATEPVRGIVDCWADSCVVVEHCTTPSTWDAGVAPADYRWQRPMDRRELLPTPLRANGRLLCAVGMLEGRGWIHGVRYFRVRRADKSWLNFAAETAAWAEVAAEDYSGVTPPAAGGLAPDTPDGFYARVKGKRLCIGKCSDDRLSFTQYPSPADRAICQGRVRWYGRWGEGEQACWNYAHVDAASGELRLEDLGGPGETDCELTFTFDTDTSGRVSGDCSTHQWSNRAGTRTFSSAAWEIAPP